MLRRLLLVQALCLLAHGKTGPKTTVTEHVGSGGTGANPATKTIGTAGHHGPYEALGKEIEKATQGIFPMQNVFVRKVKVLKKPKFDLVKLMELHSGEGAEDSGDKAEGDAEEVVAAEKDITQAASGGRL